MQVYSMSLHLPLKQLVCRNLGEVYAELNEFLTATPLKSYCDEFKPEFDPNIYQFKI